MAKKRKRTLREKAAIINFRTPKNYIDEVVGACVASGKEPNELGQVGMMLLVNHRFFDFDRRLAKVEQSVSNLDIVGTELFRIGKVIDRAVAEEDEDE